MTSIKQSVAMARVLIRHNAVPFHFGSSRAFKMDDLFLSLVSIVSSDKEGEPLSSNRPTVPGTFAWPRLGEKF